MPWHGKSRPAGKSVKEYLSSTPLECDMNFRLMALLLILCAPLEIHAQDGESATAPEMPSLVPATDAASRKAAFAQKLVLGERSLITNLPFRSIGPTVMSGRIVDVEVNPEDPTHIYAAYASGGLWKSTNNGQSFVPLFDHEPSMSIGDIAVDWTRGEKIWVGTGENNSSRSSYSGTGLYVSSDGGDTWRHSGLEATHRVGRIVLHPGDTNTVWVAALGALYSPSEDRGVYKSSDGGVTWRKTLDGTDNAGAIDLVIDPRDPNFLYAALWHRERRAWNFVESGENSGIYKSTDGGESWLRLAADGFPFGPGVGRIGLAVSGQDPEVLYAIVDNQDRRAAEEEEDAPLLTRDKLHGMSRRAFLELEDEVVASYLEDNGFDANYTVDLIRDMVHGEEIEPMALVWYVEDANRELFETPVLGAEVYRSEDGGASWQKTHEESLDGVYNSYGYYFGEIRLDPSDHDRVYILGVPLLLSEDGGHTWKSIGQANVHADHQALWLHPRRAGHLVSGNDGGLNISYDDGETWFKANSPAVGQFYAIAVDDAQPYNVYGGLQDNGVWGGPHSYVHSLRWHANGDYAFDRLLGGDGMQVAVDTRTNDIVYTGSQFGAYVRIDLITGVNESIRPRHVLGERPLRYNWQTPIHLSRHNQDVLYLGTNRLHRSFNRGQDWEAASEDLTQGGRPGDVPFGTLTTIDESPLRFGLVYVGSDDGLVHVSRDGGYTWTRVSDMLPQHRWVSRVEASAHALGRVYVALNGYRWDNFDALVFRSEDFGDSWEVVGGDLPREPVNVIVEDPHNEEVLYVGTDHGLYVSLDRGATFMASGSSLPYAPVHDLKIQERRRHLLVGTHGRSIYQADVRYIQELSPDLLEEPLHVFSIDPVWHREFWGRQAVSWREAAVPEISIVYFAAEAGNVTVRILGSDGLVLRALADEAERGLNFVAYDLSVDAAAAEAVNGRLEEGASQMTAASNKAIYLLEGTYTVEISRGGVTVTTALDVTAL